MKASPAKAGPCPGLEPQYPAWEQRCPAELHPVQPFPAELSSDLFVLAWCPDRQLIRSVPELLCLYRYQHLHPPQRLAQSKPYLLQSAPRSANSSQN